MHVEVPALKETSRRSLTKDRGFEFPCLFQGVRAKGVPVTRVSKKTFRV